MSTDLKRAFVVGLAIGLSCAAFGYTERGRLAFGGECMVPMLVLAVWALASAWRR